MMGFFGPYSVVMWTYKCNCNNSACVIVGCILYFTVDIFTENNGNTCEVVGRSRVQEEHTIPFLLPIVSFLTVE